MDKNNSANTNQEAAAKGGVSILVIIATMKYLPAVFSGFIVSGIIRAGARGSYGFNKIKQLVLGSSFFYLIFYITLGLPSIDINPKKNPTGIFYSFEWFLEAIAYSVFEWNRFFNLPIIKGLRFNTKQLSYQHITNYFWIIPLSATGITIAFEIWEYFRNDDRKKEENTNALTAVCALPTKIISGFIDLIFLRFISRGRNLAWSIPVMKFMIIPRFIVVVVIYMGIGVAINELILPHVLWLKNQVYFISILTVTPSLAVILGFLFGVGKFVMNQIPLPRITKSKQKEFYLGSDFKGRPYFLSEKNLSYHVEIVAPTGSGKTNLLKNLISDRIHKGHGIIFLDLKAEFQVVNWMMRAAMSAGREKEVILVSLANRELSVPYNPIKYGSAPEIHSQLMNSMSWSEDYYRKISSTALMTLLRGLCDYRDRVGEYFHLGHLFDLLNEPGLLREFSGKLSRLNSPMSREIELLCEKLDRLSERDKLTGLIANLGLLIHSAAGELISKDVSSGSFDFHEAVDKGLITYVLMNSMKLRETASVFGKMILQDLMRLAGDRYADIEGGKTHRPVTLVIDEFAAFAIPEFIDFMDRARGAGIGIVFAHQSRADLRVISPEFQERVEANSNTVIVSGVKSSEDAEYFAGILGTKTVTKETRQAEDGFLGETYSGMKSVREVEEYVVHPNRIKELHQGEAFTVSRTVDPRWAIVRVPEAQEFTGNELESLELTSRLKVVRESYMKHSRERYLELNQKIPGLTRAQARVEEAAREPDLWS